MLPLSAANHRKSNPLSEAHRTHGDIYLSIGGGGGQCYTTPTAQPYFTASRTMRSEAIASQDRKLSLSRHVMYESIGSRNQCRQ